MAPKNIRVTKRPASSIEGHPFFAPRPRPSLIVVDDDAPHPHATSSHSPLDTDPPQFHSSRSNIQAFFAPRSRASLIVVDDDEPHPHATSSSSPLVSINSNSLPISSNNFPATVFQSPAADDQPRVPLPPTPAADDHPVSPPYQVVTRWGHIHVAPDPPGYEGAAANLLYMQALGVERIEYYATVINEVADLAGRMQRHAHSLQDSNVTFLPEYAEGDDEEDVVDEDENAEHAVDAESVDDSERV
jgi:hypothetical protein